MKGALLLGVLWLVACGPSPRRDSNVDGQGASDGGDESCANRCSDDLHGIVDCHGNVVSTCAGTDACNSNTVSCTNACDAANANGRSVGCDYYATFMDVMMPNYCFAVFVANTWTAPAKVNVEYQGQQLNVAQFARMPVGSGTGMTYSAYDPNVGIAPGEVGVLFLSGEQGDAPLCPAPAAAPSASFAGTGVGNSFHITTDVPVVAYQISPYGGGSVAVTAASLLLPTSVWSTEYVAVNVSPAAAGSPSMNIIAREDGTEVTMTPTVAVNAGPGIPGGAAMQPMTFMLNKGQQAQITQPAELTGSTITSTKPVGFMAGQTCMNVPTGTPYCDHGEQMVPPVQALGSRYVGVMYRPRVPSETKTYWRMVGVVDGTTLTWSQDVGGPQTLAKGQSVTFETGTPFIVNSQDKDHPFMLFTYMTGSQHVSQDSFGHGDPDFVVSVPPEQYLKQYVFFADPTYPETNLVVVRSRGTNGQFADVMLDCAGPLTGWQPIGGDYEYARADLVTGNFANVGNCATGRHEIKSDAPFGLWVWGWGTPNTTTFTANVSYGYPGGMNVVPINDVILRH